MLYLDFCKGCILVLHKEKGKMKKRTIEENICGEKIIIGTKKAKDNHPKIVLGINFT